MKKLIFAAFAAGAMVLAGCTKTEVTKVPESRAIGFDYFVSNSVKAGEVTTDNISKFYVFGGSASNYNLFNNTEVTKVSGEWEYAETQYWADATTQYNFAAYSNGNEKLQSGVSLAADNAHLEIQYTTDGSNDLVYAYRTGITQNADGGNVDLTFFHILSRVQFQFTKDASLNGTELAISDISIDKVAPSATFTGTDNSTTNQYANTNWTNHGTGYAQSFDNPERLTDAAPEQSTAFEYLIPQTAEAETFDVTFTITPTGVLVDDYSATAKKFTVSLPAATDNNWKPAFTYIYTATISAKNFDLTPIVFDVIEVNDGWTQDSIEGDDDILLDSEKGTDAA